MSDKFILESIKELYKVIKFLPNDEDKRNLKIIKKSILSSKKEFKFLYEMQERICFLNFFLNFFPHDAYLIRNAHSRIIDFIENMNKKSYDLTIKKNLFKSKQEYIFFNRISLSENFFKKNGEVNDIIINKDYREEAFIYYGKVIILLLNLSNSLIDFIKKEKIISGDSRIMENRLALLIKSNDIFMQLCDFSLWKGINSIDKSINIYKFQGFKRDYFIKHPPLFIYST